MPVPSSWAGGVSGEEQPAQGWVLQQVLGCLSSWDLRGHPPPHTRRHGTGEAFRDVTPGFEPQRQGRLKEGHVLSVLVWDVLEEWELVNKGRSTERREASVGV